MQSNAARMSRNGARTAEIGVGARRPLRAARARVAHRVLAQRRVRAGVDARLDDSPVARRGQPVPTRARVYREAERALLLHRRVPRALRPAARQGGHHRWVGFDTSTARRARDVLVTSQAPRRPRDARGRCGRRGGRDSRLGHAVGRRRARDRRRARRRGAGGGPAPETRPPRVVFHVKRPPRAALDVSGALRLVWGRRTCRVPQPWGPRAPAGRWDRLPFGSGGIRRGSL